MDGPVRNHKIFSPVWDQSPPQRIEAALLCFWVEPNGEDVLARSDIPTDGQVSLWRDLDVIEARQFFLCRGSSVAATHGSILKEVFRLNNRLVQLLNCMKIDLEGRVVKEAVQSALQDRHKALTDLINAIREYRKLADQPLTL